MKTLFQVPNWYSKKYDGRKSMFKGITRAQFAEMCQKHYDRLHIQWSLSNPKPTKTQQFKETMRIFAQIPYKYEGDGMDNFSMYQRPASNGMGYVAICVGERGNNICIDEPFAVAALVRKYNSRCQTNNEWR